MGDSCTILFVNYLGRQFLCNQWMRFSVGMVVHKKIQASSSDNAMRQKPSFTSTFANLIVKPWWQYFSIVHIIRFSTSPRWAMDSGCAIFLVLSFTDARLTLLLNSVNGRSRMHMYGFYLWGIIATGGIFNFCGILSLISPHFHTQAYLCVILSAVFWRSWRPAFLERANWCGPSWSITSICYRD